MYKIESVSTEALEGRLKEDDSFQFWNVFMDKYFNGEMIPGSRRVPLDRVGREVLDHHARKADWRQRSSTILGSPM